jgi:hypothetical protein
MGSAIVLNHLGIGDHVMINGLVRHLAETEKSVSVVGLEKHKESLEFMYRDNPKIKVKTVKTTAARDVWGATQGFDKVLPLATYGIHENNWKQLTYGDAPLSTWCHLPYFQAKVNPEYMRTKFYFERDHEREDAFYKKMGLEGQDYIFVHNEPDRHRENIVQSPYKVFNPDVKISPFNIFDYLKILENAKEIHCINSGWPWVVELFKIGSHKTNFMHCPKSLYNDYYPPDNIKMVFTENIWTFLEDS